MNKTLQRFYPKAREGSSFTRRCMNVLTGDHQFSPEKTLLATSVCSDEIIRSATTFRDHLEINNPFQLGGLAGYPFAGLTGLAAFASHVPENGGAILLYGPHIGISEIGEIGVMKRPGQSHRSSCCGALKATLGAIERSDTPDADPDLDYQLWKIEDELQKEREQILGHDEPLVEATERMYETIDRHLARLIQESLELLEEHRIALIGGVIINTDHPLPDWFAPRRIEVIAPGGKRESLSI